MITEYRTNPQFAIIKSWKLALLSAILIYFPLSSEKASIGPTIFSGTKKSLRKIFNQFSRRRNLVFGRFGDVRAWQNQANLDSLNHLSIFLIKARLPLDNDKKSDLGAMGLQHLPSSFRLSKLSKCVQQNNFPHRVLWTIESLWKLVSVPRNQGLESRPIKDRRNEYIHFCRSLWFSGSQKHHW